MPPQRRSALSCCIAALSGCPGLRCLAPADEGISRPRASTPAPQQRQASPASAGQGCASRFGDLYSGMRLIPSLEDSQMWSSVRVKNDRGRGGGTLPSVNIGCRQSPLLLGLLGLPLRGCGAFLGCRQATTPASALVLVSHLHHLLCAPGTLCRCCSVFKRLLNK